MERIFTDKLSPTDELPASWHEWIYNGLDCTVTHELTHKLEERMDSTTRRTYRFSLALQAPALEMSLHGTRVDIPQVERSLNEIKLSIDKLANNLNRILREGLGVTINWRSPKQLGELFYDIMQLPAIRKRGANGKYTRTTSRAALEKLSINFWAKPICNHLLLLRDLEKQRQLLETDFDADARLRASWNIAGTNTGRFSSSASAVGTGTNSQNIDREMRKILTADAGYKLADLDLEQADARNVGAICWDKLGDPTYLDACESSDLHTQVCRLVWPDMDWTGDLSADRKIASQPLYRSFSYRDCAKRIGHGSNFQGRDNIATALGMNVKTIDEFQERYHEAFPCIRAWHQWVEQQLRDNYSLTTLMGRRRYFYGNYSDKTVLREAVAYEPQSVTADFINTGLRRVWESGLVQVLMQVHDSILIQYPEHLENEIIPEVMRLMTVTLPLRDDRQYTVPVDANTGWNWSKHSDSNPNGLRHFDGNDKRERQLDTPRGRLTLASLLETKVADLTTG